MTRADFRKISESVDRLGLVDAARGMTITAVEPVLLSHRFPPGEELAWSGGVLPGVTAALVRIRTADGLEGLGETYAGTFAPEVVRELVRFYGPLLLGEDPSRISFLWKKCYSRSLYWGRTGINVSVLSAIESALWDLCGKAAGVPVHRLLGDPGRTEMRLYASGGMDASDDDLAAEQAAHVAGGFLASKIRIGRSAEADVHKAEVASAALGPGIRLAVDAVQGSNPQPWSSETAIVVGRGLERFDLLWYEEPCAADDIEGHLACRRALDIPIAGGETLTTAAQFVPLLEAGAVDVVQPDAAHIGGILEALKVALFAETRGIATAMHVWSSGAGFLANAQVAFAAPGCAWLEFPAIRNPLVAALQAMPVVMENGALPSPGLPGLGVVLSPETERAYAFEPDNHYHFEERRD